MISDFQPVPEVKKDSVDAEEKLPKFMEDSVSSHCSSDDSTETLDVAAKSQTSVILERQRTPYSATYDG